MEKTTGVRTVTAQGANARNRLTMGPGAGNLQSLASRKQGASLGNMRGIGGGKRATMNGPRPSRPGSLVNRASLFHGGQNQAPSGRRTGIGSGTSQARITDPRPVTDKTYINQSIQSLIAFLSKKGYDQPISTQQLKPPSQSDFFHIFEFLVQQIDPKFTLPQKNAVDEVLAVFLRLRYPCAINKSYLAAVGSPHGWPLLLAALTWLVNLILYHEAAQIAMEHEMEGQNLSIIEKIFFDSIGRAYKDFMSGHDNVSFEEEIGNAYSNENDEIRAEIRQREKIKESKMKALERVKNSLKDKNELKRKKSEVTEDIEKYEAHLGRMSEYIAGMKAKSEGQIKILEELLENTETETRKKEAIMSRVNQQKINIEELMGMKKELQRLEDVLGRVKDEREKLAFGMKEDELIIQELVEKIEDATREFNSAATRIGMSQSITFDSNILYENPESSLKGIIDVDLKRELPRTTEAILVEHKDTINDLQGELEESRRTLLGSEEAVEDLEREAGQIRDTIKTQEDSLNQLLEEAAKKKTECNKVIKEIDYKAKRLKDITNSQIEQADVALEDSKFFLENEKQRITSEREASLEKIFTAFEQITNYKVETCSALEELQKKIESIRNEGILN